MSDQFLGEIRIFSGTFAPQGWAFCAGQTLAISQNQALFSILGTTYGGDGQSTFALPNLTGRAPLGAGQGAGLTQRPLGASGGSQNVTLNSAHLPAHTHGAQVDATGSGLGDPTGNVWGFTGRGRPAAYTTYAAGTSVQMNTAALGSTGGGQPHNNMPPFLGLNFIIALTGVYPNNNT